MEEKHGMQTSDGRNVLLLGRDAQKRAVIVVSTDTIATSGSSVTVYAGQSGSGDMLESQTAPVECASTNEEIQHTAGSAWSLASGDITPVDLQAYSYVYNVGANSYTVTPGTRK